MLELQNIAFTGGSATQRSLITQVHQKAIVLSQSAQTAAQKGGDNFTKWFGSSSTISVADSYSTIYKILSLSNFSYNLTDMLDYQFENEMIFCLNDFTNNVRTIKPWKGIFLQNDTVTIILPGALSLFYLVFEKENAIELEFVRDRDSASFLAKYNYKQSVLSPRNYMYFAETI